MALPGPPPATTLSGGATSSDWAVSDPSSVGTRRTAWIAVLRVGALVVLILGTFLVVSRWRFGSWTGGVQVLAGRALVVESGRIDCGDILPGNDAVATFRVKNVRRRPVTIVGLDSSCDCSTLRSLPLRLLPGQSAALPIQVDVGPNAAAGRKQVVARLMLDSPSAPIEFHTTLRIRRAGE